MVLLTNSIFSPGSFLTRCKHREDLDQRVHFENDPLAEARRRARELDIMGVEHANAAEPLFERQGLAFELDPVLAQDLRPHVGLGRHLYVRVPELEDDLGITDRKAVLVRECAAAE